MLCYKSGKSMIKVACYKSGNDNDKSNNNEDKVCLLLKRWSLMGYMLDDMLNHMLDYVLDQMLNYMLDYITIDLMITALQLPFSLT